MASLKSKHFIPNTAKLYGNVQIGKGTTIGEYSIIGCNEDNTYTKKRKTKIGRKCTIGSNVIIYEGANIADNVVIEDFSRIGKNVSIGARTEVIYGQKIYDESVIGKDAVIGGFICERVKVGDNARIFGELIHCHNDPVYGWNSKRGQEKSPTIEDYAVVGFGAKIIGEIRIGRKAYITAGSIVTRNVPSKHIACNINKIMPYKQWKGELRKSEFFKN